MKDNVKRVKKDVNKMLIISIVASVLFVVGIPLIAMFAGKKLDSDDYWNCICSVWVLWFTYAMVIICWQKENKTCGRSHR